MDALFRFLFKYPAFVFEQGEFTFAVSRSMMLAIAVAGARRRSAAGHLPRRPRRHDRCAIAIVLVGLRARPRRCCWLFCLFRPSLVLKAAVPQQNFLGVLIDDSRSMTIADTRRPAAHRRSSSSSSAARQRRCSRRCPSGSSCASSASPRRPTGSAIAGRPEVRRHGDAARARRSSARATSCRACRSPAS